MITRFALAVLVAALGLANALAATPDLKGWNSISLGSNEVVSVRLFYRPTASITDERMFALEIKNHTLAALTADEIRLKLDATEIQLPSKKQLGQLDLVSDSWSQLALPPGATLLRDGPLAVIGRTLGLPPKGGMRVEVRATCELRGSSNWRFENSSSPALFAFKWRYPTTREMAGLSAELKSKLADYTETGVSSPRLATLIDAKPVKDRMKLDSLLAALRAARDDDIRHDLAVQIFERHAIAPQVMEYYRVAFQTMPDVVYWDAADPRVWNIEFLEPLVQGCEGKKWRYFDVLRRHKSQWRDQPEYVSRLSAALLKHRPILNRQVRDIADNELDAWSRAVKDAADVGDPKLIELLKLALDDRRDAIIDLGSGGRDSMRVCNRAMVAILTILDGDSRETFKRAGVYGLKSNESGVVYDRMIDALKARLDLLKVERK